MTLNLTIDSRSLDHRTVLCKHNMMWPIAMFVVVFYWTTSVLFWVKLLLFWTAKMVNTKLLVLINWNTQVNNYGEIAVVKSSTCCYSLVMWSFVIRRWSVITNVTQCLRLTTWATFRGFWGMFSGLNSIWSHRMHPVELSLLSWEIVRLCLFNYQYIKQVWNDLVKDSLARIIHKMEYLWKPFQTSLWRLHLSIFLADTFGHLVHLIEFFFYFFILGLIRLLYLLL